LPTWWLPVPAGVGFDDGEAEFFEFGDELAQAAVVAGPGAVVGELVVGQDAGGSLAVLLAGPLVVGAVQLGRVGVAAAAWVFTRCAPGLSGMARRRLRTNLADAQPTPTRRMRAAGLVCLGAGAGLIRGDLRDARGTDVISRSGGVIVQVRGAQQRLVPVLSRSRARLLAAARFAGDSLIRGGADPGRRNITCPLIAAPAAGAGCPGRGTSRLRATWLAGCADLPGLATFMHAAGSAADLPVR
jgi:hypothetical protein